MLLRLTSPAFLHRAGKDKTSKNRATSLGLLEVAPILSQDRRLSDLLLFAAASHRWKVADYGLAIGFEARRETAMQYVFSFASSRVSNCTNDIVMLQCFERVRKK